MTDSALRAALDRQLIRDTLTRHSIYSDESNLDGIRELWAADCRSDFGAGGEVVGVDAVLSRIVRAFPRFSWIHHQLGDSLIEIDGDTATSMTQSICWQKLSTGERAWVTSRYYDELRREGDRWLITYRQMVVTGTEGSMADNSLGEYTWQRLERRLTSAAEG
jgi:hypothetical protein